MIEDYFIQECFYAIAYNEIVGEPIHQLVTIMAVENEQPLVFVQKTEDWIEPLVIKVLEYKRNNK